MRITGLSVGTLALALAAACGSADPGTEPPAASGFAAYTACLAQNGVTLPSAGPRGGGASEGPRIGESARPSARPSGSRGPGGFGGGGFGSDPDQPPTGVDQATWAKALEACAAVRPTAGPSAGGRGNSALTAYRNCLTEHGVTATGALDNLNTADPTTAAALKACEPLRPTAPTAPTPPS